MPFNKKEERQVHWLNGALPLFCKVGGCVAKIPDYNIIEHIQRDIENPELERIFSARDKLKQQSNNIVKKKDKRKKGRD